MSAHFNQQSLIVLTRSGKKVDGGNQVDTNVDLVLAKQDKVDNNEVEKGPACVPPVEASERPQVVPNSDQSKWW